jgi:hypothetical protein
MLDLSEASSTKLDRRLSSDPPPLPELVLPGESTSAPSNRLISFNSLHSCVVGVKMTMDPVECSGE